MGTADQLMDLSLTHPYPGDNKLVERLLAIKEVSEKYRKLLKELSEKAFTKEQLLKRHRGDRKGDEGAAGEGEKGGRRAQGDAGGLRAAGRRGAAAARPEDVRREAHRVGRGSTRRQEQGLRSRRLRLRAAGRRWRAPATAPSQPIDEKTFRDVVKAPDGFDVTLFAAPPKVGYPVALAAAPTGELFVAVDEQGSIGRTPGGGKVLRCVDKDGDGKVDEVTVFAKMDHPRGLIYQDGRLWVLHPPFLSVYHDGGKGVADKSEVLVTGLTSDMIDKRGGDHTTNGIRMGLDGWIYIAVGDYGCPEAKGKDGSTVTMRGGIVRVRPDGTDLEIFATGLRNPFDIGIDPFMNLFTRDNDDNRPRGLGHSRQPPDAERLLRLLAALRQLPRRDHAAPGPVRRRLRHRHAVPARRALAREVSQRPVHRRLGPQRGLPARAAHARAHVRPETGSVPELPRPTGMDMDGSGRLYVASWRGGEASTYVGPNVGFIARVTPKRTEAGAVPQSETGRPRRADPA